MRSLLIIVSRYITDYVWPELLNSPKYVIKFNNTLHKTTLFSSAWIGLSTMRKPLNRIMAMLAVAVSCVRPCVCHYGLVMMHVGRLITLIRKR